MTADRQHHVYDPALVLASPLHFGAATYAARHGDTRAREALHEREHAVVAMTAAMHRDQHPTP